MYFYNYGKPDSSFYHLKKAESLYKSLNDFRGENSVIYMMAINQSGLGNLDEALKILEKYIANYKTKVKDSSSLFQIGKAYSLRGDWQMQKGNFKMALNDVLKGLRIIEKFNDPIRKADALSVLSSIERAQKNFSKALEYDLEALQIYRDKNDKFYEAATLNDLGLIYGGLKQKDSAISSLEQSLAIFQKLNEPASSGIALMAIAGLYIQKGDYNSSLVNLEESISLLTSVGDKAKLSQALLLKGITKNKMNKPKQGLAHINQALDLADSVSVLGLISSGYQERSAIHSKLGNYETALKDHKQFVIFKDSMFNITKSKQIEELRAIHDTEKKEQKIALQDKEIMVLEQKASISNLQKLLLGIGLLLSLIGFYAIRQKMKRNKLEKEKVDAELDFKKKELTTHALNLARKNETLENLKSKAQELKEKENTTIGYNQLIQSINFDLQDDNNWKNFSRYFEEVHKDFNSTVKAKYPQITSNELRLLALLKMNLSSKEIANILNISSEGIKKARYRLRKKLNITTEDSLQDLVLSL
ncbi:tetratricopeptide repeat protein [Costertonia aggregata]|uniref:Tetratricopeptide repeat protein n=1 Tax=Costertonia aggregata TaxID=343403 RepID=A0A7H9AST0_9FLAO|nr:tetratricopeptide repeat protein [Costertonia aggregata]